jgi:hypothetical protein
MAGPEVASKSKPLLSVAWIYYESNAQEPPCVTFVSNTLDGLEPTLMMWGAWYEHATGFLYWDIAAWTPSDPWGPTIGFNKTGDGVLLYPGNHDGVMAPVGSPPDVTEWAELTIAW